MGSAVQALPYFGRAWKITIDTPKGEHLVISSDQFEEALRVTFAINTYAMLAYWTAELNIYNLNAETANKIAPDWDFNQPIESGATVSISAGYHANDAQPGVIFSGTVFQPIWTRENVVDNVLTLRCVVGLLEDSMNFASFPIAKGAMLFDRLGLICNNATYPIKFGEKSIDADAKRKLSEQTFPRAQVVHGRPFEMIKEIAKQKSLFAWVGTRGLQVRSFTPATLPPAKITYKPASLPESGPSVGRGAQTIVKPTLIGTPQQTQDGVSFRVLLDPQVEIGDVVQLAPGTSISGFKFRLGGKGEGGLPPVPAHNGEYVVAGVRHIGDTRGRGDDWFTELAALTLDFFPAFRESRGSK